MCIRDRYSNIYQVLLAYTIIRVFGLRELFTLDSCAERESNDVRLGIHCYFGPESLPSACIAITYAGICYQQPLTLLWEAFFPL